jgi:hypothetical protein
LRKSAAIASDHRQGFQRHADFELVAKST